MLMFTFYRLLFRKSDNKKPTVDNVDQDTSERLQTLERQILEKDKELTELRQTCSKLQQERETMLASPHRDTRTSPKTPPRAAELERQNNKLKQRLAEISLDMDQDRVRYQASLAEAERNARQARDDAADQVEKLRAQHQRDMNQIKGEFAVRHSTSVVTELKSKLASQDIVIQKLRDQLIMETKNSEDLVAAKVTFLEFYFYD
jgi:small-conductance mechanosensitive channel